MNTFLSFMLLTSVINSQRDISYAQIIFAPYTVPYVDDLDYDSEMFFRNVNYRSYFTNLNCNFDYNYSNKCSFVALEQVLSFFDTFYNDNIVPERFDMSANVDYIYQIGNTECFSTDFSGSPGASSRANNPDTSLQPYNSNDVFGVFTRASEDELAGCPDVFASVFSQYSSITYESSLLSCEELFTGNKTLDEHRELLSAALSEGLPVVIEKHVDGSASIRHTAIAIAMQDDLVLYNNGYSKSVNDNNPLEVCSLDYVEYAYIIRPSPLLEHVCSNNYIVNDSDGKHALCPCLTQGYNLFSNHVHQIDGADELHHNETCPTCSRTREVPHTYSSPYNIDNYGHYHQCVLCGEEEHNEHNFNYFESGNENYHTIVFDDNCQLNEAHSICNIECYGNSLHQLTCPCGYSGLQYHFPCIYVNDGEIGVFVNGTFELIDLHLPELEAQNNGWVCLCGYSNTLSVSADTAQMIVDYVLEEISL